MAEKKTKRPNMISSILFAVVVLTCIFIHFAEPAFNYLTIILLLGAVSYFYWKCLPLFGPSLFFFFVFVTSMLPLAGLGLILAIPLLAYFLIVLTHKPLKERSHWLKLGQIDKMSWIYGLIIVAVSSATLYLWARLTNPNLNDLLAIIPKGNIAFLILAGLGFALLNALVEESIYRGILWDGLGTIFKNTAIVAVLQAAVFGLAHINGFPRGATGVVLAFVYGCALGYIRHRTKGLMAPIIIHIAADLTVFFILLGILGKL